MGLENDQELLLALLDELDTMDAYNLLAVEDITRTCATICRPGGMMVDDDGDVEDTDDEDNNNSSSILFSDHSINSSCCFPS